MSKIFLISFSAIYFLVISSISSAENSATAKTIDQVVQTVSQYCGACHTTPSPNLMPKSSWPYAVDKMAEIAQNTFKKPFIPADAIRDIKAFYYGSAPTQLPPLPYGPNPEQDFDLSTINKSTLPLVTSITPVKLLGRGDEFLVCDAETNAVSLLTAVDGRWSESKLADIEVPSRATTVDFDNDGDQDILVASLGLIFPPQGTFAGKVYLLLQHQPGEFKKIMLLDKIGRVNDVKALDMDGDKDLDIVIAVFGGDVNGALGWLENRDGKYYKRPLANIGGALNVSPVDLNNDGLIDIVSYFAQEHESMVAFMNKGKGQFEQVVLFQANNPMFGVTSVEAVDLDNDGDTDFLFSNGDAHDLQFDPKPYHGVQWLENKGNLNFEYHDIGRFYGAANATASDLDGDGDKDIVASSWNNYWDDPKRMSLIWYENNGKQEFTRHNILAKPASITALAVQDVTGDKKPDILTGVFQIDALKRKVEAESEGKPADILQPQARISLLKSLEKKTREKKKASAD